MESRMMRSCWTVWLAVPLVLTGVLPNSGLTAAEKAVSLQVVDKAGYDKAIAKHKGKVVLVDCWATWCVPCIRAFPKTVALHEELAKDGLVVVSLSFDSLSDDAPPPKTLKFLQDKHATFENFISKLDISEDGADAFQIEGGALPHFKLYGRDGRLLKTFSSSEEDDSSFTHADIENAVKAALQK